MPTKTEYKEYLATERWSELRRKALQEPARCERCFMPRWLACIAYDQDLNVHHKSYANRGTDKEELDLEPLCRRCHELETFGRTDLKVIQSATCGTCRIVHFNPYSNHCETCSRLSESDDGQRFLSECVAVLQWNRERREAGRKERECIAQDEVLSQVSSEAARVLLRGMCAPCNSAEFRYVEACIITNRELFEEHRDLLRLLSFLKDRDPKRDLLALGDVAISRALSGRVDLGGVTRPEADGAVLWFRYKRAESKQKSVRIAIGAAEKRGDQEELSRLMQEKLKVDCEMKELA